MTETTKTLLWWQWLLILGMTLFALAASLRVLDQIPAQAGEVLAFCIELVKLAILAGILWVVVASRNEPPERQVHHVTFIAAALISLLTDWAWLLSLGGGGER